MSRSIERNSAFFFGAFGTALGVFGSAFAAMFLALAAFPDAVKAAPDWVLTGGLFVTIGLTCGLWFCLDHLVNRNPLAGGLAIVAVVVGMEGLGIAAIVAGDPSGFLSWLAIVGGLLLLVDGWLAYAGGGTDPLTWETLRTPRVRQLESRLNVWVALIRLVGLLVVVVGIGASLVAWDHAMSPLVLAGAAVVAILGLGWLLRLLPETSSVAPGRPRSSRPGDGETLRTPPSAASRSAPPARGSASAGSRRRRGGSGGRPRRADRA